MKSYCVKCVAALLLPMLTFSSVATCADDLANKNIPLDPQQFRSPPNEYRPIDCWWWDSGYLTQERLRWQLEEMHAKGAGGTWLYPRFGASQLQSSEPGFWTDGWWEFVRFVLDEHQRLGMVQYANDWLGRLDKAYFQSQLRNEAKQRPELIGRRLVVHQARSTAAETLTLRIPDNEQLLAAAAYRLLEQREDAVDGDSRIDLIEFVNGQELVWEAPEPEWLVVVVCSQPHDLNYLGPEVKDRWIEIFFEQYRKQLVDRLGKSLVGYGPDERSVLNGNILYSDVLQDRLEHQTGGDPLLDLTALFIDIGAQTDRVRCQYYDAMNDLLEENLYAPMADWLHDHNMQQITIATWGREDMLGQTSNYGDFPRMMKYFDITGNEDSKESGPLGAFIDTKLSSSMAHLNEKNRVAVCAYWGVGWGFTQQENIARTNINYALGVNLYNTHGVLYSLLAGRNEFVPPEVHFYQPYWQTWRTFSDYVSRLSYILSQGQPRADVALVYPLATIHANWHSGSKFDRPADDAQNATFGLAKELYDASLDFDFVDEARLAQSTADAGLLKVSELQYPVVVLPAMTTIGQELMARLQAFVEAGGTLVVFRQPPTASVELGRDDPELEQAWQALLGDYAQCGDAIVEQRGSIGGRTILVRSVEGDVVQAIRDAIEPDVASPDGELAHIHRQVGNQHIYYLVNRTPASRNVAATVRSLGTPEIWDAKSGEVRPLYRFQTEGSGTTLRLQMAPHDGVLVVMQPTKDAPQIVADNLQEIETIAPQKDGFEVQGTMSSTGEPSIRMVVDGRSFAGQGSAVTIPAAIELNGEWECEYRPTLNNQWGDFRYPASDESLGPEAPRMRYRAEPESGAASQWHAKDFDDHDWQVVSSTFGPFWQVLGPIDARLDSEELRHSIVEREFDPASAVEVGGDRLKWTAYSYSWKFGADRVDIHQFGGDGLGPVSPDVLVFDVPRGSKPAVRYLTTRIYSPSDQKLHLDFGSAHKLPTRQAWVNGELVAPQHAQNPPELPTVRLRKGWNRVVLRIESGAKPIETFAVFHQLPQTLAQPRFMPLSRWHELSQDLVYDCYPAAQQSVGWYRFQAPPGSLRAKLNLEAEAVQAWVDGEPVAVVDDTIAFPSSETTASPMRQVALRVTHKRGHYDGAAFTAPIAFQCGRGRLPLGDWCKSGLDYYSGGVKYFHRFQLKPEQLANKILLDLGEVRTSAEVTVNGRSVGVRLAEPFTFDLTEAVREGENEIEVEVLNTLANFMSAGHTRYVYDGQTVSGLLGPARVKLLPKVRVICRPDALTGTAAE